ncbi:hypothetical protein SLE2022_071570 [Rubroshorea leprosula]
MGLAEEPNNPLLLLNYAQFPHLVLRDHDRAEECFKRAIQVEPPDAVALTQYADFLWKVRRELWEAEERYQQAMAAKLTILIKHPNMLISFGALVVKTLVFLSAAHLTTTRVHNPIEIIHRKSTDVSWFLLIPSISHFFYCIRPGNTREKM